MKVRLRVTAAVLMFVLVVGQMPAGAWGNDGHLWINLVAAKKIPASMPTFLRLAAARISYLGPEPDRWRNPAEAALKYSQEPDHFIDFERIPADFGDLPKDRYLFMRKLFERRDAALAAGIDKKKADELLPDKVGLQPYITMEIYGRLKVAFREYRRLKAEKKSTLGVEQNIVLYAGWLGHYVADGSQPLHCTVSYDGWVGPNPNGYRTEKGFHGEFESAFVKEHFAPKDFAGLVKAPVQLKSPFEDYLQYLKDSLALVPNLYELEKAGGFKGNGSPEAREFTRKRLAAGSQMLLNLWYTAWMESAVVPPDPYTKPAATTEAQKSDTKKPAKKPQ